MDVERPFLAWRAEPSPDEAEAAAIAAALAALAAAEAAAEAGPVRTPVWARAGRLEAALGIRIAVGPLRERRAWPGRDGRTPEEGGWGPP